MKRFCFLFITLILIMFSPISAHQYEMLFSVKNNLGEFISRNVTLYKVVGNQLVFVAAGATKQGIPLNEFNGACDIEGSDGSTANPEIKIWDPLYNFEDTDYVITIDDYYIRIRIGIGTDINFYYTAGTGFTAWNGNRPYTFKHTGISQDYNLSFNNDFEDGLSGGQFYLDENLTNAPYSTSLPSWSWSHTAEAKTQQTAGGFTRKFYQWNKDEGFLSQYTQVSLGMTSGDYEAKFNKYYDVVIQNQLPGYSNQGQVTVDDVTRNSPYNHQVKNPLDFSAAGILQYIDNVKFAFSHWLKNGQTTGETSPFEPDANNTYTAVYTAKPTTWSRALYCNSPIGQPIVITWNEHPSAGVTSYKIYRKAKDEQSASYIGTVSRGVGSFTDPDYIRTSNPSDDLLFYDVRAYYAPANTYADEWLSAVTYGFGWYKINGEKEEETTLSLLVNNYPNPFNPVTRITFQLPEKDFVNLRVYNSIGEFVVELINETKEKGAYYKDFDGGKLPSGVYYAVLKTNNNIKVSKMLLTK